MFGSSKTPFTVLLEVLTSDIKFLKDHHRESKHTGLARRLNLQHPSQGERDTLLQKRASKEPRILQDASHRFPRYSWDDIWLSTHSSSDAGTTVIKTSRSRDPSCYSNSAFRCQDGRRERARPFRLVSDPCFNTALVAPSVYPYPET